MILYLLSTDSIYAILPVVNSARALKQARKRAKLSQRHLAELAGFPQSHVARIEAGNVIPRVDTLDALLEMCGVGLEVLPRPGIGVDRTMYPELLALSPRERLRKAAADAAGLDRLMRSARRR